MNEKKSGRGGSRLEQSGKSRSPRPRKKMTKQQRRRTIVLAAAVVIAVLLALFAWYRNWAKAPDLPGPDSADPGSTDPAELGGEQPYLTGDRKENFYTFLIVGRDTGGGGNTDTIMLAAYDIANQQAALMSIPRDTMVNASWDVKKINSVYNVNGGGEEGMDALCDYVATLVGFRPDFTVTVEWEAVGEIVEEIGGVWFDVPFYMHYVDPYQDLYIDQEAGYRLLSGEDAMEVVRWRKNNDGAEKVGDGSDLGRTQVQQEFIAAMIKQCLQIKNVTKLTSLADIFTQRVTTELTVGNLCWFAEQALLGGFSTENIFMCTMPNTAKNVYSRSVGARLSYVVPNADELIAVVNEHFNPYEQDVTLANLDLMSVNSDGSVSASSGTVRDSKAAYPESYWKPAQQVPDEPVEDPVVTAPAETPEATEPGSEETAPPTETETPETERPDGQPGGLGTQPTDPVTEPSDGPADQPDDPGVQPTGPAVTPGQPAETEQPAPPSGEEPSAPPASSSQPEDGAQPGVVPIE